MDNELKEILKIRFNKPLFLGIEDKYIGEVLKNRELSGGYKFTNLVCSVFEEKLNCRKALLTTSCTHSLEMAALIVDIKPGDEVIMPSFTFVSTANAFVLRGAKIVFVDICPDTMNMDTELIESAITNKTKVIVPVHYAGIACEMDRIIEIAEKYNLLVIEDAAQAIYSTYKGKFLGTIGNIGCCSFHETKNITCGEGGSIFINDEKFIDKAHIIRQKGTNREQFFQGKIDKYSWVDIGSSYILSEFNAAYLYGQLINLENITKNRLDRWNKYYDLFIELNEKEFIDLPGIFGDCKHNGHMFYIKAKDLEERNKLIEYLSAKNLHSVFHYVPLHSSKAGKKFGRFQGEDRWTTKESDRLLRLPLYYDIPLSYIERVVDEIRNFYRS